MLTSSFRAYIRIKHISHTINNKLSFIGQWNFLLVVRSRVVVLVLMPTCLIQLSDTRLHDVCYLLTDSKFIGYEGIKGSTKLQFRFEVSPQCIAVRHFKTHYLYARTYLAHTFSLLRVASEDVYVCGFMSSLTSILNVYYPTPQTVFDYTNFWFSLTTFRFK